MDCIKTSNILVNTLLFPGSLIQSSYHPDSYISKDYDDSPNHLIYIPYGVSNFIPAILVLAENNNGGYFCIHFHGNACDIGQIVKCALRESYYFKSHYLIIEYPRYGIMTGFPSEASINDISKTVHSYVTNIMNVDPSRIVLIGRSIGSGPACALASQLEVNNQRPAALILQSPFCSVNDAADDLVGPIGQLMLNRWENWRRLCGDGCHSLSAINSIIKCHVLLIHADCDQIIDYHQSFMLHEARIKAGYPCELFTQTSTLKAIKDHNYYDFNHDYILPIRTFLVKTLTLKTLIADPLKLNIELIKNLKITPLQYKQKVYNKQILHNKCTCQSTILWCMAPCTFCCEVCIGGSCLCFNYLQFWLCSSNSNHHSQFFYKTKRQRIADGSLLINDDMSRKSNLQIQQQLLTQHQQRQQLEENISMNNQPSVPQILYQKKSTRNNRKSYFYRFLDDSRIICIPLSKSSSSSDMSNITNNQNNNSNSFNNSNNNYRQSINNSNEDNHEANDDDASDINESDSRILELLTTNGIVCYENPVILYELQQHDNYKNQRIKSRNSSRKNAYLNALSTNIQETNDNSRNNDHIEIKMEIKNKTSFPMIPNRKDKNQNYSPIKNNTSMLSLPSVSPNKSKNKMKHQTIENSLIQHKEKIHTNLDNYNAKISSSSSSPDRLYDSDYGRYTMKLKGCDDDDDDFEMKSNNNDETKIIHINNQKLQSFVDTNNIENYLLLSTSSLNSASKKLFVTDIYDNDNNNDLRGKTNNTSSLPQSSPKSPPKSPLCWSPTKIRSFSPEKYPISSVTHANSNDPISYDNPMTTILRKSPVSPLRQNKNIINDNFIENKNIELMFFPINNNEAIKNRMSPISPPFTPNSNDQNTPNYSNMKNSKSYTSAFKNSLSSFGSSRNVVKSSPSNKMIGLTNTEDLESNLTMSNAKPTISRSISSSSHSHNHSNSRKASRSPSFMHIRDMTLRRTSDGLGGGLARLSINNSSRGFDPLTDNSSCDNSNNNLKSSQPLGLHSWESKVNETDFPDVESFELDYIPG